MLRAPANRASRRPALMQTAALFGAAWPETATEVLRAFSACLLLTQTVEVGSLTVQRDMMLDGTVENAK